MNMADQTLESTSESSRSLRSSLRKSLARALTFHVGAVVLMCAAGAVAGLLVSGVSVQQAAFAIGAMLLAGALPAVFVARRLASRISAVGASPIELLLDRPELCNDISSETVHWTRDTALTWREVGEDLDALRRLMRRASRKSAALATELRDARAAANSTDDAKAQFVSRMSHELRTPLNAILGYATLLREDAVERDDLSATADLERILVAARNLLDIVNDLLGLADLEKGKADVGRHAVDIRHLVDALTSGEHANLRDRLQVNIADEVRIIIGDEDRLHQCLTTLIGAAAQSAGTGSISVRVTPTSRAGIDSISFEIRATAAHNEAHSASVTDAALSVAIARRLAAVMGGDCVVKENASDGPSFTVTLPVSPDEPEVAVRPNEKSESDDGPQKCVLIVDDDEAAVDLMRRWLAEIGYDALVAHDGETGLRLAREKRPQLIILDGFLPGRSGYEIVADLRADPSVGCTPVIFVTVDDDRRRAIVCGASDYLRKPLTEAGLRATMELYAKSCSGEVLIIEDDDDAAELLRRGVEEVGFSTRRARDGLEGIDMAAAHPPSAIVLDVHMPQMDGFAVIERLAGSKELNRIPIVIVSGHDMGLAEHRRLAGAAHRVFTKGIASPREIAQSLREAVA